MTNYEEIFQQLKQFTDRSALPGSDGHDMELGFRNAGGTISAFAEAEGDIGLFIPFGSGDHSPFRPDLKSRYISLRKIHAFGTSIAQLRLEDPLYEGVFSIFVNSYLESVSHDPERAVTLVAGQLKKWRSLFTPLPSNRLSPSAELGLIGELETLKALLEIEGSSAFFRWTGPDNQAHDFRLEDRAIECKSTQAAQGLMVSINGMEQLLPEAGRRLLLVVRRYEKTPNGPITLPRLVREIANDTRVPADEFLKTLQECGYSFAAEEQTDENHFRFREHFVFEVGDDFPRLLPNHLPPRTHLSSYAIDLYPPYEIPGHRKDGSLN